MPSKDIASPGGREIESFVERARGLARSTPPARIIFALDATASREPTWKLACRVQSDMFGSAVAREDLAVQLVFYRGFDECRASKWVKDPDALVNLMMAVRCKAGQTQIRRILRHGYREAENRQVHAIVFVGDCVEEDVDELGMLAGRLALRGVRLFLFQEGDNSIASRAFHHLAQATKGAHCKFDASAPDQLRELLAAVATYARGGTGALKTLAKKRGGITRLIEKQVR